MSDKRESEIKEYTVAKLKELLVERNLSDSGKKVELQRRLVEAIRMESGDYEKRDTQGEQDSLNKQEEQKKTLENEMEENNKEGRRTQGTEVQDNTMKETTPVFSEDKTQDDPQENSDMGQVKRILQFMTNQMQVMTNEIQGVTSEIQGVTSEIQGVKGDIQKVKDELQSDLQAISEKFDRKYELHQVRINKMEDKMGKQETKIDEMEKSLEKETKSLREEAKQQENIFKEDLLRIERKQTNENIKTNRRITDLEGDVQKGIQTTLDLAEEENRRTEARLREELKESIKRNNPNNNEMVENLRRQLEKRLTNISEEVKNLSDTRIISESASLYFGCNGKVDESSKFCGDFRKVHPINFIKTIKSRARRITNTSELREFLRGNLTGQALLWLNCKEDQIQNMEDFEKLFLHNFWGELQQGKVREKLYFGKFDAQRNNLTNYALQVYSQAQYLVPSIPESEIVMFLSRHYKSEICETISIQNIHKFDMLLSYLTRVERNLDGSVHLNNLDINLSRNSQNNQNRARNNRNYNELIDGNNQTRKHYNQNNSNESNRGFQNRHNQYNQPNNNLNRDFGGYNQNNNFQNYRNQNNNNFQRNNYNNYNRGNNGNQNNENRNNNNYNQNTRNPQNVDNQNNNSGYNRNMNFRNSGEQVRRVNRINVADVNHRGRSAERHTPRRFSSQENLRSTERSRSSEDVRNIQDNHPHF